MRKPLIHTHCHLICWVYIKGHMSVHIVWCWRCWDRLIQEIKAISKVLKIFYKFQCFKCYVCQRWCLWLLCNTAYRELLLILLMSMVSKILCTLYTVASRPCQEGRLFVTVQHLKSLPSWGLSCSPPVSLRRQLCWLSWICQTGRVIAGKTHSQSPILKTKGAISNLVILTDLWEQSCILHTLTKLPA